MIASAPSPNATLLHLEGEPGTGKTTALARRVLAAAGERAGTRWWVSASNRTSLGVLLERIAHEQPGGNPAIVAQTFEELALEIVAANRSADGVEQEIVDEIDAAILFRKSAAPLLSMEWAEILDNTLDPEVTGLKRPDWFCENASRLIFKLRDACVAPQEFFEAARRGAVAFYSNPPNLITPQLLGYTPTEHHRSLAANAAELEHQFRREMDLAKILHRLYESYLALLRERGCLTPADAVVEATEILRAENPGALAYRGRFAGAFVDDAQELTVAQVRFLQALFGDALAGVTLAADPQSALSSFAGARPDLVRGLPGARQHFGEVFRSPHRVIVARAHLLSQQPPASSKNEGALTFFRADSIAGEADFIAQCIAELPTETDLADVAVIFRSVRAVQLYERALLRRNVLVQTVGDVNLYEQPDVLDALALLWSLADPYRHEWLLRVLAGPWLGLSDATLSALCVEPQKEQPLFQPDEHAPETRPSRWDRRRELRLAWNVLGGDRDDALTPTARERLAEFRSAHARWSALSLDSSLPNLARAILGDGLRTTGEAGTAHAMHQRQTAARFLRRLDGYGAQHPDATLREFLRHVEERAGSSLESCEEHLEQPAGVRLLSVAASQGREFAHIFLADARAGGFPRYYSADSFLYSPKFGVIPKENAGDARSSRTAKFSYYMHRARVRERYNSEERAAFAYALSRAHLSATVTASERPTRARNTPEFLSELQNARIAGAVDLTGKWKPAPAVREQRYSSDP